MISCHRHPAVVIIDPSVTDYSSLIRDLALETRVFILDPTKDGVEQITQVMAEVESIESLHILSHGSAGTLHLGSTHFSWQTLDRYTSLLQTWAKTLKQGSEILLYGCEVAAGAIGQWFVQQLKLLTGAEIAASTNRTGSAELGGDWNLEFKTGPIRSPLPFSAEAMMAYGHALPVFVEDTFRGSDIRDPNWLFGTGQAVPGSPTPEQPFLTARNSLVASPGGIPGNPIRQLDPEGEGALRLTSNIDDQAAFVLFNKAIQSNQGLTITFELFSYNPNPDDSAANRADGVSFFLLDGNTVFGANPKAGAFGGSLGYAQKNSSQAGAVDGIAGGYVGIGFDEFGNFSSATDFAGGPIVRTGGNANGRVPDSISIRAGAGTNYNYVTDTGSLPFGIDDPNATTREAAKRTVKIDLTPGGRLSIQIDGNNDGDFADPGETNANLQDIQISGLNGGSTPQSFKFGFASGTGDFNNIHEVRNLVVATLNNPPSATDFGAAVIPGSTSILPGFFATDPDAPEDSVESYTILTLPDASDGVLYIGDPAQGGVPVTANTTLTPTQIANVYFQATNNFDGSSFTYTATDTRGSVDATPAIVTLTRQGNPPTSNNLPPDTAASSLEIAQGAVKRVPGLSGTDSDGTVESFTILTLPTASQGVLYLGNPSQGGTPIEVGQVLTTTQIQQVFFKSSATFSSSRFTYAATDNLGTSDPTPAVVTLSGGPVGPEVPCAPGKTKKGTDGDNQLKGTPNIDNLRGLDGNDQIRGFDCPDNLKGGRGNDKLIGGAARDQLFGQQNRDVARGNAGDDVINLGLGKDTGFGGKGDDVVYGRRGNDTMSGKGGKDELYGGRGKDTLYGNSNSDFLDGQQNDDFLQGGKGDDFLNGGLGNDRLRASKKADVVLGRRGDDVIFGGGGADLLRGQRGNDRISGNTQRDKINGGAGDDVLTGGGGNDRIRTGEGQDRIRYRSATQGVDRITDFDVAQDQIDLRSIFRKSAYTSADPFKDYVRLGNASEGTVLRVDADGGASGNFVRLAILLGVNAGDLSQSVNFLV